MSDRHEVRVGVRRLLPMPRLTLLVLAVVVALAVGAYAVFHSTSPQATSSAYLTAPVRTGNLTVAYTATGELVPATEDTFSLPANASVSALHVSTGQSVRQGQPLVSFSDPSLEVGLAASRWNLYKAESQLSSDQANLAQLVNKYGETGSQDMLAVASAQVSQSQSELGSVEAEVQSLNVVAPFAGKVVLAQVPSPPGGGRQVVTLASASFDVTVPVPETEIPSIHPGQPVNVKVNALPSATITGKVSAIAPFGSYSNGVSSFNVTVAVDAPPASTAYGMSANVSIVVASVSSKLLVPLAALHQGPKGSFVLVETSGHSLHRVPVTVLLETTTTAAVSAPNLASGQSVVLAVPQSAGGKTHLSLKGRAVKGHKPGASGPRHKK